MDSKQNQAEIITPKDTSGTAALAADQPGQILYPYYYDPYQAPDLPPDALEPKHPKSSHRRHAASYRPVIITTFIICWLIALVLLLVLPFTKQLMAEIPKYDIQTLTNLQTDSFAVQLPNSWQPIQQSALTQAYADTVNPKLRNAVFGARVHDFTGTVDFDELTPGERQAQLDRAVTSLNSSADALGLGCGEGSRAAAALADHLHFNDKVVKFSIDCRFPHAGSGLAKREQIQGYLTLLGTKSFIFMVVAEDDIWQANDQVFRQILDSFTPAPLRES